MQEIGSIVSFKIFSLHLGSDFCLAAQADPDSLPLFALAVVYETCRKKFGLVCLFKMQTVSVFFCILSVIALVIN